MAKRAKAKAEARAKEVVTNRTDKPISKYWIWGLLALVTIVVVIIRARMLSVPLERDEGEYALGGQLLLRGVPPYSLVYNMKFPGIYVIYAAIMAVFGQNAVGIHLGLLVFNLVSIVLVFLLAKRFFDDETALFAAAAFAALSLARFVLGFAAHATNFILVPMLAGLLLTLMAIKSRKLLPAFLAGLLLGIAPMIKQQGAPFALFGLLYIVWKMFAERAAWKDTAKTSAAYVVGATIPFALVLMWMKHGGVYDSFRFWCFDYAREYAHEVPLAVGFSLLRDQVGNMFGSGIVLMCLGLIGLAVAPFDRSLKHKRAFILGFAVLSFLSACPGLYFREHYFVPFMPALAILVATGLKGIRQALARLSIPWSHALTGFLLIAGIAYLVHAESYLMFATPSQYVQRSYPTCPFAEAVEIGKYIKEHAKPGDKLAIIGSEPEIYFYSGLRPATGYIYFYALTENQKYARKMEREATRQLETSKPRFVAVEDVPSSRLGEILKQNKSLKHVTENIITNANLIGLVNMVGPDQTDYFWGQDASLHERAPTALAIFERKQ